MTRLDEAIITLQSLGEIQCTPEQAFKLLKVMQYLRTLKEETNE